MKGELSPYGTGGGFSRADRQVRRDIERLHQTGQFELARIDQQAELEAERVSAIGYIGKRAMHEITMLSQLEVQLSTLVPAATARLQGITDITALGMADLVSESVRKVK